MERQILCPPNTGWPGQVPGHDGFWGSEISPDSPAQAGEAQRGLVSQRPYGAVEIDAISKSILRAVLFALFEDWHRHDANVHYFPSFEIVRWIGSMMSFPAFGAEDAASRHVSAEILTAVYAYFLRRYAVEAGSAEAG